MDPQSNLQLASSPRYTTHQQSLLGLFLCRHLQSLPVRELVMPVDVTPDVEELTLHVVKCQLPLIAKLSSSIQGRLQSQRVLLVTDGLIEFAIIGKGLDVADQDASQVIHVDNEQSRCQHRSLRDSTLD